MAPPSIGSFHAVAWHVHNTVVAEFGDPSFDDSIVEDPTQEVQLLGMCSPHFESVVSLEEFPWATGISG